MFRSVSTRILAFILLVSGLIVPIRANDVVPRAAAGAVERPPKILVLPRGRVLSGDIRITESGYEVAIGPNTGRTYVAKEMVWFTARSLPDAYKELKKRYPDRTADGYVALAGWCLQQGLYDQARENLRAALQLEPDHSTARVVAQQLGKSLSQSSPARGDNQGESNSPAAANVPPSTSPRQAKVSEKELTQYFVSRIQPVLMNGCGNAACHGRSSESPFRLQNVRSGHPSFNAFTEQNLKTVESFVNMSDPANSPLLTIPRDAHHAALPEALFEGTAGQQQWQSLVTWVNALAQSRGPREPKTAANSTDPPQQESVFEHAHATIKSPNDPEPKLIPAENNSVETILQHAIKSGAPDAFDPDDFNRRFAPQTDRLSTPLSNGPTR